MCRCSLHAVANEYHVAFAIAGDVAEFVQPGVDPLPEVAVVRGGRDIVPFSPIPHKPRPLPLAIKRREELLALLDWNIIQISLDDQQWRLHAFDITNRAVPQVA